MFVTLKGGEIWDFWPRGRKLKGRKINGAEIRGRQKLKGLRYIFLKIFRNDKCLSASAVRILAYEKRTEKVWILPWKCWERSTFSLNELYQDILFKIGAPLRVKFEVFNYSKGSWKSTLLSEMEYDTCKFISDGFELRSFLMSKPKFIAWFLCWFIQYKVLIRIN